MKDGKVRPVTLQYRQKRIMADRDLRSAIPPEYRPWLSCSCERELATARQDGGYPYDFSVTHFLNLDWSRSLHSRQIQLQYPHPITFQEAPV